MFPSAGVPPMAPPGAGAAQHGAGVQLGVGVHPGAGGAAQPGGGGAAQPGPIGK